MENASKILLIAGGTLITLLILALGIYVARNIVGVADEYDSNLHQVDLQKYNSNFISFCERKDITAQEVVTLIGFVQKSDYGTKIFVEDAAGVEEVSSFTEPQKNNFLKRNSYNYSLVKEEDEFKRVLKNTFSCTYESIEYDNAGYIIEIKFKKEETVPFDVKKADDGGGS